MTGGPVGAMHQGGGLDPYFSFVSMLLHCDGANLSTTFTDSSRNNLTVTAVGNAKLTTASPKFGTACGTFDGAGDALTVPANEAFNLGTGDWTVEMWVKTTQTTAGYLISLNQLLGANNLQLVLSNATSGHIYVFEASSGRVDVASSVNDGNWHHVALSRVGSDVTLWLDGTQLATYVTSFTFWNNSVGIIIGERSDAVSAFNGQIDDVRITKGVGRYLKGTSFTPPAQAFPNF